MKESIRRSIKDWLERLSGMTEELLELEREIIAFLEKSPQDWDSPEQEESQRRCHWQGRPRLGCGLGGCR